MFYVFTSYVIKTFYAFLVSFDNFQTYTFRKLFRNYFQSTNNEIIVTINFQYELMLEKSLKSSLKRVYENFSSFNLPIKIII